MVERFDTFPHRLNVDAQELGDHWALVALGRKVQNTCPPIGHKIVRAFPLLEGLLFFGCDLSHIDSHSGKSLAHTPKKSRFVC